MCLDIALEVFLTVFVVVTVSFSTLYTSSTLGTHMVFERKEIQRERISHVSWSQHAKRTSRRFTFLRPEGEITRQQSHTINVKPPR